MKVFDNPLNCVLVNSVASIIKRYLFFSLHMPKQGARPVLRTLVLRTAETIHFLQIQTPFLASLASSYLGCFDTESSCFGCRTGMVSGLISVSVFMSTFHFFDLLIQGYYSSGRVSTPLPSFVFSSRRKDLKSSISTRPITG